MINRLAMFNAEAAMRPFAVAQQRERQDRQQEFTNRLAMEDREYRQERDQVSDRQWQQQFGANQAHRNAGLDIQRERLAMARERARQATAAAAQRMSREELAAEAEDAARLGHAVRQLEAAGDTDGIVRLVMTEMPEAFEGRQPDPENVPLVVESLKGSLDFFQGYQAGAPEPYQPQSPEGKLQADVDAGVVSEESLAQGAGFEDYDAANKSFRSDPVVKDFATQAGAYQRILASAEDPSPAGDLALIFNYMKLLDPGSVVRESEFATAERARAWLQQNEDNGVPVPAPVARGIRALTTGQRLSGEQRTDFVDRAERLYGGAEAGFSRVYDQYASRLSEFGMDPARGLTDYRYQAPDPSSPPADLGGVPGSRIQSLVERYGGAPASPE